MRGLRRLWQLRVGSGCLDYPSEKEGLLAATASRTPSRSRRLRMHQLPKSQRAGPPRASRAVEVPGRRVSVLPRTLWPASVPATCGVSAVREGLDG